MAPLKPILQWLGRLKTQWVVKLKVITSDKVWNVMEFFKLSMAVPPENRKYIPQTNVKGVC